MALGVALIWLVSWQGGLLDQHIARSNEQFSLMRNIVGGVIELISK